MLARLLPPASSLKEIFRDDPYSAMILSLDRAKRVRASNCQVLRLHPRRPRSKRWSGREQHSVSSRSTAVPSLESTQQNSATRERVRSAENSICTVRLVQQNTIRSVVNGARSTCERVNTMGRSHVDRSETGRFRSLSILPSSSSG